MNFLLFTRTRHLKTCQYFYLQQKQSLHLDSDVLDDKQTLLKNTANSLYKVGYLRLASDKTSENVYQHFAEPTNTLNLNIDNYKDIKRPPGDISFILVQRFGELLRKLWNPKNFKAHVSPHEMLQAVVLCSKKKFQIVSNLKYFLLSAHTDKFGT